MANPTASLNDDFGYAVAVSGNTVVVGAIGDDTQGPNAGAAYVFALNEMPVLNDQTLPPLTENSPSGTVVGTVVASDPDVGQTKTFSIIGGNTGGAFNINSSTGVITVANTAAIDFETNPIFTLKVQVTDNGTPNLSDTGVVTINLKLPLTVLSTSFQPSGTVAAGANVLTVTFSEPVVGANLPSNYELRRAGVDGLLLGSDEVISPVSVSVNGTTATLTFATPFVEDIYRLTVKDAITDVYGHALDTDAGANGTRDFVVNASTTALDASFGASSAGRFTTSFGNGHEEARSVVIQSDGKIIVGGGAQNNSNHDFALARYNVDGTLDTTFGVGGKVTTAIGSGTDVLQGLALQSDGKIVAVGYRDAGGSSDIVVVRYNANGTLDSTFGSGGKVITAASSGNDAAFAVAIQGDGKIVVTGFAVGSSNNDFAVLRYNTNGTLDTTFDGDGMVITPMSSGSDVPSGVAVQADGKIVVAGYSHNGSNYDFAVARYNTNGSLDTTFDGDGKITLPVGNGDDGVKSVKVATDGKILVAGTAEFGTDSDFAIVRFNPNGTLDTTFDTDGKMTQKIGTANDYGDAIAVGSDGKIVMVGTSDVGGGNYDFAVARFNTNGSIDTSFDLDGPGRIQTPFGLNSITNSQAIQSDGKIVLAGISYNSSNADFALARYNADGSLDMTFDGDGKVTTAIGAFGGNTRSVVLQSDGKIVVAGYT
ncbi:MAG: cadherin domain-containing protein [Planctomycetaceae bacterium]